MEDKINTLQGCVWMALFCIIAVGLVANAVAAAAGAADFAWWHLPGLVICRELARMTTPPRVRVRIRRRWRDAKRSLHSYSLSIGARAVRRLAALLPRPRGRSPRRGRV